MIITLTKDISSSQIKDLTKQISQHDERFNALNFFGEQILFLPEHLDADVVREIRSYPGIDEIYFPPLDYQLCSTEWRQKRSVFEVNGVKIGGDELQFIAGPCAVESEEQLRAVAAQLKRLGIKFIRGGAYKPRTSPYSFQGLETEGLRLLRSIADEFGLVVVTEVIDRSVLDDVIRYADILQIGARNMQNFFLLKELGRIDKPIFLKRGMSARIPEWLGAAEYVISGGNPRIILCERGIRTFDTSLRNTIDIAAIPLIKELSHLPIFADPSHGTGSRKYIKPLALAATAAGADGIMVETHPSPDNALSDGPQSVDFDSLEDIHSSVLKLHQALRS